MTSQDTTTLQKGLAKTKGKAFQTIDPINGKRKVQINASTWVYTTSTLSDEEVIYNFNKKYEPQPLQKWNS